MSDIRKQIEEITREYLSYLERYIETDSDDFTGMHTTTGIPDDGFYGELYKMDRKLEALIQEQIKQARLDDLLWIIDRTVQEDTMTDIQESINDRIKELKK